MMPCVIAVVGPTATGKTDLAIVLAQHFNTSVINCDSRQFYKEMTIGTAKPSHEQLAIVPHHFINFLSVIQHYTAGDFEKDALALSNNLFTTNNILIACGGSGLFVKAFCEGLGHTPEANDVLRAKWQQLFTLNGLGYLQEQAKQRDTEWYAQADIQNPRRLLRALEIMDATGMSLTALYTLPPAKRDFNVIYVGLNGAKRTDLYNRIDVRVDRMVDEGLEEEVRGLLPYKAYSAFNTIGYREWLPYFNGEIERNEVISNIKLNTRHFAKRQLTWFNRVEGMHWFQHRDHDTIIAYIEHALGLC